MSNFEIFLIVMVCAVPFVALLMVLPKKIKKANEKNKEHVSTKTYEELKKEEEPKPIVEEQPKQVKRVAKSEISTDDFKNYLNKRKPTTKPNKLELPADFIDRTIPYTPRRRRLKENKPKTLSEEIQNLSPELKTLIIAGVLDTKNFDNI